MRWSATCERVWHVKGTCHHSLRNVHVITALAGETREFTDTRRLATLLPRFASVAFIFLAPFLSHLPTSCPSLTCICMHRLFRSLHSTLLHTREYRTRPWLLPAIRGQTRFLLRFSCHSNMIWVVALSLRRLADPWVSRARGNSACLNTSANERV